MTNHPVYGFSIALQSYPNLLFYPPVKPLNLGFCWKNRFFLTRSPKSFKHTRRATWMGCEWPTEKSIGSWPSFADFGFSWCKTRGRYKLKVLTYHTASVCLPMFSPGSAPGILLLRVCFPSLSAKPLPPKMCKVGRWGPGAGCLYVACYGFMFLGLYIE